MDSVWAVTGVDESAYEGFSEHIYRLHKTLEGALIGFEEDNDWTYEGKISDGFPRDWNYAWILEDDGSWIRYILTYHDREYVTISVMEIGD